MREQSSAEFTTTISLDQSPEDVFDASTTFVSGGPQKSTVVPTNSELRSCTDTDTKTFTAPPRRSLNSCPEKKVVWHVVESHIHFVADKTEWNGTNVVFEITRKGDNTELRFTHVGLVPAIQCYGDCVGAWGFYINDSLRNLITKGKGQPNRKKRPRNRVFR